MIKEKEAKYLMAELTDLELDPEDIEELLAAARITQQLTETDFQISFILLIS